MSDEALAQRLEQQGDHGLAGCVRCGLWDRDENARLMCCCPPDRYAEFHPEPKEAGCS